MARRRPRTARSNAVRIFPELLIDPCWLRLSVDEQWLYLALCCQTRTTTGPTVAYDPEFWLTLARDVTLDELDWALRGLVWAGWAAVVDQDVRLLKLRDITLPGAATAIDRERTAVTLDVRRYVFARDGEVCRACGATSDLAIDHVVALAVGGTSAVDNLAVLCRQCNGSKGSKPWDEWIEGRR